MLAGGEDGAVKLLDVFYNRRRHTSNAPNTTDDLGRERHPTPSPRYPASETFQPPYAKVVQTLPMNESSVGALGVGTCGGNNIRGQTGLQSTLVVSGGGKMEARTWCAGGVGDQGGIESGGRCVPVRFLFAEYFTPPLW